MDERERIAREIITLLPDLARSLNRDVAGHMVAMHDAAGNAAGSPPEVSGAQLRTLIHLAQYGAQTMGELAEGLQITMASATGLVKPLVQMGYVTRSHDVNDQRVVRVALSPRAQQMADTILAERRREVESALTGMNDQACRDFLEGLERLVGRRDRS
jgi:DNA-binding MarR family transcriptional regulator